MKCYGCFVNLPSITLRKVQFVNSTAILFISFCVTNADYSFAVNGHFSIRVKKMSKDESIVDGMYVFTPPLLVLNDLCLRKCLCKLLMKL